MPQTTLTHLLTEHAEELRKTWLDQVLVVYSEEYGKFVRSQGDRFANPAGVILTEGIDKILTAFTDGADEEAWNRALDPMVRLLAVQELAPAQALAFIPRLKKVLRDVLGDALEDASTRGEMSDLEKRIDRLTLMAFDIYIFYRQRIFEVRINELKRKTEKIVERFCSDGASCESDCADGCGTACGTQGGNDS